MRTITLSEPFWEYCTRWWRGGGEEEEEDLWLNLPNVITASKNVKVTRLLTPQKRWRKIYGSTFPIIITIQKLSMYDLSDYLQPACYVTMTESARKNVNTLSKLRDQQKSTRHRLSDKSRERKKMNVWPFVLICLMLVEVLPLFLYHHKFILKS